MKSLPTTQNYLHWQIGNHAQRQHTISREEVRLFVDIIGDSNPIHQNLAAPSDPVIVPGAFLSSLATGLVGSELPGSGCMLLSQEARYLLPAYSGDTTTVHVEIVGKDDQRRQISIATRCVGEQQELLMMGVIIVQLRRR